MKAANKCKLKQGMKGFTLIELLIILFVIALLAAFAIPSYREFVLKNAEDETKAQMLQIQNDLERYKAKALTYKNYRPQNGYDSNGNIRYAYNNANNTEIYVPIGSDANTHRYTITLVDGQDTTKSLVSTQDSATTVDATTGMSWKMYAEPNQNKNVASANKLLIESTGLRCTNAYLSSLSVDSTSCETGGQKW